MKHVMCLLFCAGLTSAAVGAEMTVKMDLVDAQGNATPIGTIMLVDTRYGLVIEPDLKDLKPGLHGFHVHANPSCAPAEQNGAPVAALAAGGHFDPEKTDRHSTPWGDGHLGDLPPLHVAEDGTATQPVLAPRLKVETIMQRSLMVHAGGDIHADHPAPLGGGGARVACGVIK